MDLYTTCFTLPRRQSAAASLSPASSFEILQQSPIEQTSPIGTRPQSKSTSIDSSNDLKDSIASVKSRDRRTGSVSTINSSIAGDSILNTGTSHVTTPTTTGGSTRTSLDLSDSMQRLCAATGAESQCTISCNPVEQNLPRSRFFRSSQGRNHSIQSYESITNSNKKYNFHISGGYPQVMNARGKLLRENPFETKSILKVARSEILDAKGNMKVAIKTKLDEIASLTNTRLAIVGQNGNTSLEFGLETEKLVEIVLSGQTENVDQAKLRLLVALDEENGLHAQMCEIDYKLHNIISGRKCCVIQSIQEETATNFYFSGHRQNSVFITGEFFGVQRAREMLFQVSMHKSKCIISRDTAILPRKLDSILLEKPQELKQIMYENATFIHLPSLGTQNSLVSVFGDNRVNIERSIRTIMQLAAQFYTASVWLLPKTFDLFMPQNSSSINPNLIATTLKQVCVSSGCEAVFKPNCFEFHGTEAQVRGAVSAVLELEMLAQFHHEIRFQVESSCQHFEFIAGKKNGKLNKIIKTANVKIKFESFNEYNFLIEIAGNSSNALHGLSLLQEELPAEISFHVPEMYHKRIIGVGGKNIQKIMRKFGVYVKFSNAEEFAATGGYFQAEDNVIARTPAKNANNLDELKQAVMELVHPKDKDFLSETISIPRKFHRILLGEKNVFIHDIESKTGCRIKFANKDFGQDDVTIFGPESQIHLAAQMLLDHVPFEALYRLTDTPELTALLESNDFVQVCDRIQREFNILLSVSPKFEQNSSGTDFGIKFSLNRSNLDLVSAAKDVLEQFLAANNISVHPNSSVRVRANSLADTLPLFNSKLFSNISTESEQEIAANDRSVRLAASSPNIKALFDGNHAFGQPFTQQKPQSTLRAGSLGNSNWNLPRQASHENFTGHHSNSYPSHQNTYPATNSSVSNHVHRPSVSSALAPIFVPSAVEDKLKELSSNQFSNSASASSRQTRNLIGRAQSLDLTQIKPAGTKNNSGVFNHQHRASQQIGPSSNARVKTHKPFSESVDEVGFSLRDFSLQ